MTAAAKCCTGLMLYWALVAAHLQSDRRAVGLRRRCGRDCALRLEGLLRQAQVHLVGQLICWQQSQGSGLAVDSAAIKQLLYAWVFHS